jgi:hypothetical protein
MNACQICDCEEVGDAGARLCPTALPGVGVHELSGMRSAERIIPVESSGGGHQSSGMANCGDHGFTEPGGAIWSTKSPHQMKPPDHPLPKLTSLRMAEGAENGRDLRRQV